MITGTRLLLGLALALSTPATAQTVEYAPAAREDDYQHLPATVTGRVHDQNGLFVRQWPGTYFETAFEGSEILFEVGRGQAHLAVSVDGVPAARLLKPAPGLYRISALRPGPHRVRIDDVSENQTGTWGFAGFLAPAGTRALPLAPRARQIEFIGDSYTVGYGNTSPKRECTRDEVWATTDAAQGFGPRVAARFQADYQVNAISGRGIVRNYDGGAGDPLPLAYPFVLFDKATPYRDPAWTPDLIVIGLGTNDFSTPLKPGEKWATREALQADYRATYVRFVQDLRARNPQASLLIWATDGAGGEIAAQARQVAETLKGGGETRIGFIELPGLEMTGCNYHPSLKDDARIADAVAAYVEGQGVFASPRSP